MVWLEVSTASDIHCNCWSHNLNRTEGVRCMIHFKYLHSNRNMQTLKGIFWIVVVHVHNRRCHASGQLGQQVWANLSLLSLFSISSTNTCTHTRTYNPHDHKSLKHPPTHTQSPPRPTYTHLCGSCHEQMTLKKKWIPCLVMHESYTTQRTKQTMYGFNEEQTPSQWNVQISFWEKCKLLLLVFACISSDAVFQFFNIKSQLKNMSLKIIPVALLHSTNIH